MKKKEVELNELPPLPKLMDKQKINTRIEKEKKFLYGTVAIRRDLLEKLKAYSYWERLTQKDLINEILEKFFLNKDIKPIPKRK